MPERKQNQAIVDSRMSLILKDGNLVQTSPMGKEIRKLTPQESLTVFSDILEKMKQQNSGQNDNNLPINLGLVDETVNRDQFATFVMMSGAAMKIASDYGKEFSNLSLEEKFSQANLVVQKMGELALGFEEKRLQIAQLDAMQALLSATKEFWTRDFLKQVSTLPTAEKRLLFQTMEKLAGLAMIGVAGQIPDQVFDSGIQKVTASANAIAEASQATARARIATRLDKEKLESVRAQRTHEVELRRIERENQRKVGQRQADDITRRSIVEASALEKEKEEALNRQKRESSLQLNREGWGALWTNIKTMPSDTLNGLADFVFDSNDGIFVKASQAFTAVVDHLSENTATTRIIGFGAGGGIGLAAGVLGATWLVTAVEGAVAVTSTIGSATIWGGGGLIGLSGAAAGAYLGPNIVLGVRNTYDFFKNVTKDTLSAIDTWVTDPKRRWNKP